MLLKVIYMQPESINTVNTNKAQFIYEISPLIYVFFPFPLWEKVPLKIPISFIPISLIAANGKIFQ